MAVKSPVFLFPEPQHFSDYGFDPQIDYFQVLEEARKHQRETPAIDSTNFWLQKPNNNDEPKKPKRKRWWKNVFLFFTRRRWIGDYSRRDVDVHHARTRAFRGSVSGPVYMTESSSRSGSCTPRRTTSSGPLRGEVTVASPYLSLRELNMEQQHRVSASSPKPVYLVT